MNVIHIHDKCSQHAVFLPFTLDANRNLATVNAYDNQQSIQRILSHPFAANCSESTTRNNTYLFDTNTNLHQSKTKPRSSMSTLFAKFQPVQTPFTFDIDASIIDIIIGDMSFHPDDHDGTSRSNAIGLFKLQAARIVEVLDLASFDSGLYCEFVGNLAFIDPYT